jgi:hypothetical protein
MEKPGTRLVRLFFILLGLLVSLPLLAHADVASGMEWLVQQQQADGSFYTSTTTATPVQATGEALLTLYGQATLTPATTTDALGFLDTQADLNAEDMARRTRIAAQQGATTATALAALWSTVNPQLGLGDYANHDSGILATADALRALTAAHAPVDTAANQALAWLMGVQATEGGWALAPNAASVFVTAQVLAAIEPFRFQFNLGTHVSDGTTWLLQQQSSSGWGSPTDTALALLAIIPVTTDSSLYQTGINALKNAQLADGSWDNDVFATALALRALQLAKSQPVVTPPTEGSATGVVQNASSNQPLGNVTVSAASGGVTQTTVNSTPDGHFALSALTPGSYVLTYTAAGFASATQTFSVQAGQQVNLGIVQLTPLPTTALLSGVVTDAQTGQPLAATLTISGASTATVMTGADGSYAQSLAPGALIVTVSATGYHSVTANATITAGEHLAFSPSLYPDSVTPPTTSQVKGQVVDATTHTPLLGATVAVEGTSIQTTTDMLGNFILQGIPTGSVTLSVSLPGYQTITLPMTSSQGASLNAGTLYLSPEPPVVSTLEGQVTDATSGAPIAGVIIKADGLTAQTDAQGDYQLTGLTDLQFNATATADGYVSVNQAISLAGASIVTFNIAMQKANRDGVEITQVSADKPSYAAYDKVRLVVSLTNNGEEKDHISLFAKISDSSGKVVDQFFPPTGNITLTQGQSVSESFDWDTTDYAPGQYHVLVQAIKVISGLSYEVFAEGSTNIQIEESSALSSAAVSSTPDFGNQGATEAITFQGEVIYETNQSLPVTASLTFLDPDQTVLYQKTIQQVLSPAQVSALLDFGQGAITFQKAGKYTLEVTADAQGLATVTHTTNFYVQANGRITPTLTVSPSTVVPAQTNTVRINLHIVGSNEGQAP